MAAGNMVTVTYEEISSAFEFVASGAHATRN